MTAISTVAAAVCLLVASVLIRPRFACAVQQDAKQLIPRSVLFGGRDRTKVGLSPDGRWLSYVAAAGPDKLNNVFVRKVDSEGMTGEAIQVTFDAERGVADYTWSYLPDLLLYRSDPSGRENYAVYSVNVSTGDWRHWLGGGSVQARVEAVSARRRELVVVRANDRHPAFRDLHELNLATGASRRIVKNGVFARFFLDHDLNVRLAYLMNYYGQHVYYQYDGGDADINSFFFGWSYYGKVPFEEVDTTRPMDFDESNENVYWANSLDSDLAKLELKRMAVDFDTAGTTLYTPSKADVAKILLHPDTKKLLGVAEEYDKLRWTFFDDGVAGDFAHLAELEPDAEIEIISSDLAFTKWIVSVNPASSPPRYYLYDRLTKRRHYLFAEILALDGYTMPLTESVEVTSRDGLVQLCYLSTPAGRAAGERVPLVLYVHGGPWARDRWRFSGAATMFADRGYATLRCNYRGSTGFGKAHLNAGNGQWAAAMHDDVLDAADWAVRSGLTDNNTIAVFGVSYGGYESLVSASFSPGRFACHLSVAGMANLVSLYDSLPVYWAPLRALLDKRLGGNTRTEEGRQFLRSRSPLFKVDRVTSPVLLAAGENDARVPNEESESMASALHARSVPVTYVLFANEGHGIARPDNLRALAAYMEHALADCFGGRAEPVDVALKPEALTVVYDHVLGLAGT